MGYVAINVRQDDLLNGIFVKAGSGFRGGDFVLHMHEEDYKRGALVLGLFCEGRLIPCTWKDDSGDYRACSYPKTQDEGQVIDVEVYGGTKEQFERSRAQHARFCETHGWTQGLYAHFPAAESVTYGGQRVPDELLHHLDS